MFDTTERGNSAPLLMTSNGPRKTSPVDQFRRTREKRLSRKKSSLLSALSGSSKPAAENVQAEPRSYFGIGADRPEQEPAYQTYGPDMGRPLIDPNIVLSTLWQWRWPIVGLTIAGGVIGAMIALSTPREYTAIAQVMIDPREIKLVDRDLTPEFLSNEASLAIVDSRLALATSATVLERVIEKTNLEQNPEFNGEGGRLLSGISLLGSILSGSDELSSRSRNTIENLRDALDASRVSRTFIINISAESKNPDTAALLANEVAATFIEEQTGLRSNSARTATSALSGRLAALQADVEAAEKRVERFRSENNLIDAQGRLITEDELVAINASLTRARTLTFDAKAKADAAKASTLDNVVSGALPTSLVTPALTTLRTELAALQQQQATLSNQLGPRHPRLTNNVAAIESAENNIRAELKRIVAATQAELRSAVQNEQALAAELAQLKSQLSNNSEAVVTLRELEREATVSREIYQSGLRRARETGEIEALNTSNALVFNEASPPLDPSSLSRKIIASMGAMAGFATGVGLALLQAISRSIAASQRSGGHAPVQNTRNTAPPAPSRRTPDTPRDPKPGGGRSVNAEPSPAHSATQTTSENAMYTQPYPQPAYYSAQPAPAYPQQSAVPMAWPQAMQPGYPAPQQMPQQFMPQMMANPYMQPVMAPPPPVQPQPVYVPVAQPAAAQHIAPETEQTHHDALSADEMHELRQSLQDIREVVDHLAARRYG